ncbi:MAG: amidohydrolase [Gemmatimonadales bacterium]
MADLVLTGGLVWTCASDAAQGRLPTAVAIGNGRILAVGTDHAVIGFAGSATERIDLAGRMVLPGFIDNHTHFIDGGFTLAGIELRDAATPAEFVRRIADYAAEHPGEWVLGGGWDHELWGGELPRRDWIDSVTPETPVFVSRVDLHMGLANSKALELAVLTADTQDPPGGAIVRGEDGRPTGILKDAAQTLIARAIPARSESDLDRALGAAVAHAVAHGVTALTDMGSWEGLETYRRALARGLLPLRAYVAVPLESWARMRQYVAENGRGNDRLFWGGVKGFVDGSLGSTTAWFHRPYGDAPETSGLTVTDTEELHDSIVAADRAGLHVMVHAIGTRANDWLLDAFAAARKANGERDRRFRIEHAQHLSAQAIDRFGSEGVIASMQPYHAIDDGRWAERRIGPERIRTTYAFRDLLDAGATVTFGSDWTVAPLDPLLGIYAAATRRTLDGANPEGWVPEQKISVAEAVTAYTASNAYAVFLDREIGRIEVGKYADMVVLSDDIFAIDPAAIRNVAVDLTIVDGKVVFCRPV